MRIVPIRFIFLLMLFSVVNVCYTALQEHNFLFERKSLQEIRKLEESLASHKLGFVKTKVAKDYFPGAEANHEYYPIVYSRINDSFYPQLQTSYFYKESDSTLLSVSYEWSIMNYVKNLKTDGAKLEAQLKREQEYLDKYNSIKTELISKYGKPSSAEENTGEGGHFYRLRWSNKENDILMLFKFSTQLKTISDMKFGSYEIRVKVDFK